MYASCSCYNNGTIGWNYNNSICTSTNWLFNEQWNIMIWTVSPGSASSHYAMYVWGDGYVVSDNVGSDNGGLRPSVYLNTNVSYISGDGSTDNPFIIN